MDDLLYFTLVTGEETIIGDMIFLSKAHMFANWEELLTNTLRCKEQLLKMDIGAPVNVRHITHVTFDRLQGFLGLPIEFELEVPRRVPSASASAFGVSAESMQCSFDAYGNSVPTILLLLQERLYEQGGLKTEGIFRINPDNSKEEQLREQINKGVVPHDIDTHCLAGLIKAWFRELPKGVLDSLSPERVLQCHTEDQCVELVKALPPAQSALFDWVVNLMADVVHEEASNKMNARNVAVVFAPNMTQMLDPLMALKHAVQVMNLLKTLILKTLRDRGRSVIPTSLGSRDEPLAGGKEKQCNEARLVQAVDIHPSKERTAVIDKSNSEGTFKSGEAHKVSTVKETQSLTKPLATTEIVEETGSANGSEWSSSTCSSRRGSRDEDEDALDDQCRHMRSYAHGDGIVTNTVEDKFGQSQPLAYWLRRKGHFSTTIRKHQHVLNDEGPHFTQSTDEHFVNRSGDESSLGNHKPFIDWLQCEQSPTITFQLLKEATTLEQDEKPKIKLPGADKPACNKDCHTRVAHPLSKRTHHVKIKGMV
ncbi:hypothetical protein GOP47_0018689 [Adiantum capillus-veneris]|uniref:Uncharacterized protein n=1 Tax=Adiantum capillus-veneris TaxID=13818 RepID=A0A9D4UDW1_ADICA|nr:hypothetical protein GOP47_0018689 [Adiantum capillus-veneris]